MSADRDNHLWLQFWRDRRVDFHRTTVNPLLTRFWPSLNLAAGSRVFVPLCGKSLDLLWLAAQGHHVIGVELSPLAVRAFFKENNLHPHKQRCGKFTRWQSGRISILCGDYFALNKADLGDIDTIYDCTALTALPEDIRQLYIAHLKIIVSASTNVFLLTAEDAEAGDTPEQALDVDREITALYEKNFDINLTYVESLIEKHPDLPDQSIRADYKVYRITGKAAIAAAVSG